MTSLVEARELAKAYPQPRVSLFARRPLQRAVDGVSLSVEAGRNLAIVGESGSGKSTLARLLLALETPTSGDVALMGRTLRDVSPADLRALRAHAQMVFQDPAGSLDPRQRVGRIVDEPLRGLTGAGAGERRERVAAVLKAVGLAERDAWKYPHEFSGGQRQRIAIARALISRPALVVADEPVSALDVSVQAQVLNLMMDLERDAKITFLVISHDLAVVSHLCEDVGVMFAGRIVERGPIAEVFARPAHPYTRALLDAAPRLNGAPTAAIRIPAEWRPAARGCAYSARCPFAQEICRAATPTLTSISSGRSAACHFPLA